MSRQKFLVELKSLRAQSFLTHNSTVVFCFLASVRSLFVHLHLSNEADK